MVERSDISRLPPHKIEQARQRIAVVAEFAKIPRPTRAVAALHAERLGLRTRRFYKLVSIYREQGSLDTPYSARTGPRLAPAVEEIIKAEIAREGPGGTARAIAARVALQCAAAKLPIPSESTIRSRLLRARRGGSPTLAYPELVLVGTALDVNVLAAGQRVAAWLTLLLHTPTATVLGHIVSAGSAGIEEAINTLLAAIARTPSDHPADAAGLPRAPILLQADSDPRWKGLSDALGNYGLKPMTAPAVNARTADVVIRVLGDQIGGCSFRPRIAPQEVASAGGEGIKLEVAQAVIAQAFREAGSERAANVPQISGNARLARQLRELLVDSSKRD